MRNPTMPRTFEEETYETIVLACGRTSPDPMPWGGLASQLTLDEDVRQRLFGLRAREP